MRGFAAHKPARIAALPQCGRGVRAPARSLGARRAVRPKHSNAMVI